MENWLKAARLRTLPLSVSGVLLGGAYANYQEKFDILIFVFSLLTTISFQVLSNFANDYGDGIKGTDKNRVGEQRMVAGGFISAQQMKRVVIYNSILSFFLSIILIYLSFGKDNFLLSLLFLILGIASITAAIKYTVGKSAYGYSGFGDIFVFIFFGLVAVIGSNFLYTKQIDFKLLLPAFAIGMMSIAVLNLNNMRDIDNDKIAGKNTLIVKFGSKFGLMYQRFLLIGGLILVHVFMIFVLKNKFPIIITLAYGFLFVHLKYLKNVANPREIDTELKKIALLTFFISLYLSIFLFLY